MRVQDVEIKINITEPGVYCLGFDGATGKSYLYSMVEAYCKQSMSTDILAITYDSRINSAAITARLESFNGKIILLDRFDLYCTDDIIDSLVRKVNSVVLLDLKSDIIWRKLPVKFAKVHMQRNVIEVSKKW